MFRKGLWTVRTFSDELVQNATFKGGFYDILVLHRQFWRFWLLFGLNYHITCLIESNITIELFSLLDVTYSDLEEVAERMGMLIKQKPEPESESNSDDDRSMAEEEN